VKLFINYRREDAAPYAGRLYDRLAAHYGEHQVFIDIDQVDPGEDFVEVINRKVASCEIAIVAIGPNWLGATDAAGKRRLDDSEDFVRMEIVAALERKIRVVPVLVGGARMPRKQDLPEALAPLSRRNAVELSETRFHSDVSRLIEAIEKPSAFSEQKALPSAARAAPVAKPVAIGVPESKEPRNAPEPPVLARSTKPLAYAGGALLVLLLVGLGFTLYLRPTAQEERAPIADQRKVTPINSAAARLSGASEQAPVTRWATTAQPSDAEMMRQMMELAKPNENHKLLADLDGIWNYTIKSWMNSDPNAKPQESQVGIAVRKSIMDGRFFLMDVTGKLQMPDADGKMKEMTYTGMGVEGYDNVKKKFVGSWSDNMGTGIQFSEGTYDPVTKTFNYTSEMEPVPAMKSQVREVLKIADNNHMTLEWYENQGGGEKKTMEINYTRYGTGVGGVRITTSPSGATVTLGGLGTKETPATFDANTGKYSLFVELDGYEPVAKEVEAKEGRLIDLGTITLQRGKSKIDLSSVPRGAKIFQGDTALGATPFRRDDFPSGRTTFLLVLEGYLPREFTAQLNSKELFKVMIPLAKPLSVYKGTIGGNVPVRIKLGGDLKSGTMAQSSTRGETVVKFAGVWTGATLRAVTHELLSKPEGILWEPESFTLHFSDDGKTAAYECNYGTEMFTASLGAP
jgi:Protein of unknown function (DUF1579)/TIR domain/PEGA domain